MPNPFEKPPTPTLEKRKEEPKIPDELIKEDKDLRAEFFKLRERLEKEEIPQNEKKLIKERLKEINEKCEPISKELNSKSEGFYSAIMDIPVKKKKGMNEKEWQDTVKKSGETLKEAEEKLGNIKDVDPNIKKYLEDRIKRKREQLGISEVIPSEPTPKEIKEKIEPEKESEKKLEREKTLLDEEMKTIDEGLEGKEEEKKPEEEKLPEIQREQMELSDQRYELEEKLRKLKQEREEIKPKEETKEIKEGKISEIELNPEQKQKIASKLEKFGLKPEDLKEIEGFDQLSYGQRLLVLENLKQLTLGRIQEEAAIKYRKNTAESKFLGRIWQSISKKYQIAKLEKATDREITKGGMGAHKETLQQLVNGTKELGLEAVERDGKLEIQYATDFEKLSSREQKIVDDFNKVANEFSRMPYEWGLKTASEKEQGEYHKRYWQYDKAMSEILKLRFNKNNNDSKEASLYVNSIGDKVALNQFFNTHPEVEKQLQRIREDKTWLKALSNVVTERGLYFTAGFVTRSITASLIGLAGIPLAAAGMGGWIAGKRARETLIEREKMARKGVEIKGKGISREEKKSMVDAQDITKRLQWLCEQIEATEDEKRREELLGRLGVQIEATQGRLEKGWINFGGVEERLKNQLDFIQTQSKARVCLEGNKNEVKTALETNLIKILGLREKKISKERKKYIVKQIARGAALGATFALAGYALKYFGDELGWWEKLPKLPGVAAKEAVVETQVEPGPEVEPGISLEIGSRGPEGTIIDYLKHNPDIAKKSFGWDGQTDLSKFSGITAHQSWLEWAEKQLGNPEMLERLKEGGYSQDLKGLAEMMHRIGEGNVQINPDGTIDLENMKYLGARIPETGVPHVAGAPHIEEAIRPTIYAPEGDTAIPYTGGEIMVHREGDDISYFFNGEKFAEGTVHDDGTCYIVLTKGSIDPSMVKAFNATRLNLEALGRGEEMRPNILEGVKEPLSIVEGKIPEKLLAIEIRGISPDTKFLLDDLIYKTPLDVQTKALQLAELVKDGKIEIKDFARYYTTHVARVETVSPTFMKNLENNFDKVIRFQAGTLKAGEGEGALMSITALETLLLRLFKG